MKLLSLIVATALLASPTAVLGQEPKPKPASPEKKVCRTVAVTGSILGGKRVCRTKAEWAGTDQQNRNHADQFRDRSGGGGMNGTTLD